MIVGRPLRLCPPPLTPSFCATGHAPYDYQRPLAGAASMEGSAPSDLSPDLSSETLVKRKPVAKMEPFPCPQPADQHSNRPR